MHAHESTDLHWYTHIHWSSLIHTHPLQICSTYKRKQWEAVSANDGERRAAPHSWKKRPSSPLRNCIVHGQEWGGKTGHPPTILGSGTGQSGPWSDGFIAWTPHLGSGEPGKEDRCNGFWINKKTMRYLVVPVSSNDVDFQCQMSWSFILFSEWRWD